MFESISKTIKEGRLRWYGHVRRRRTSVSIRKVENILLG